MPTYFAYVNGFYVNDADIVVANEMGSGDHFIYMGQYAHNIYINGGNFVSDGYFGVGFNFRDSNLNTDESCVRYCYVNNIKMTGTKLVSQKSITETFIYNSTFKAIDDINRPTQPHICIIDENSSLCMDNCIINAEELSYSSHFICTSSGSINSDKIVNLILMNSIITVPSGLIWCQAQSCNINATIKNNNIKCSVLFYLEKQDSIYKLNFINNEIVSSGSYLGSSRGSNSNTVIFMNNNIISSVLGNINYCFYNQNQTENNIINMFFNKIDGYKNVVNDTTSTVKTHNDYLGDVLITLNT